MPNLISDSEILSIISNFDASIAEYEIIDMEKYQGWSSKYLYLLVSADDNFILKAKTADQIEGYDNEVKVCNALLEIGIPGRRPILTKSGGIFYEQAGLHWCLMTYIPGAPSHVNEYTENTVSSLATHIDQYVVASTSQKKLKNLGIRQTSKQDGLKILGQFVSEKSFLESVGVLKGSDLDTLYPLINEGYEKFLKNLRIESILHNDMNPRNILIDHKSKNVISLIDWDHVGYGNPLKDVSDAVAIFYDFLSLQDALKYKKLFYKSFTSPWFTEINPMAIEYAFLFYFTVAKWQAVLFYLNLLREYDNKYGERARFISEMKQIYAKWKSVIVALSSATN